MQWAREHVVTRRWLLLAQAWRQRRRVVASVLTAEEADFSPPALALEQRPVSPTLRITAGLFISFLTSALLWAALGRVDIVATANGKVIPSGRTKTIASVDTAVVQKIRVREGQAVKAGDVLLELDASALEADRNKAAAEQAAARLQIARSRALIEAIASNRPPQVTGMQGVAAETVHEAQLHLTGQYLDFAAKLAQARGDIQHYAQALPVAAERERIYEGLLENQDVPRDTWLEKKQERIEIEGHLAAARHARDVLITQTQREAYEALTEASKVLASSSQDAIRAASHVKWLLLRAPVDGTIQQLMVHTEGGVVQAAQPLMLIVPAEKRVEVEAFLSSKDVGFVETGQRAQVKVDAFDYTKYGTIPGQVAVISHDSIEDKDHGLMYSVKVVLQQRDIEVQGRSVALTPGMSANVEIKTGSRHILEYVLSPLLRHQHESFHER